jgi:hypothetical protein
VNSNGTPKLPTSEQIELGEIAVNYADGHETLAIKNSNGDVVSFSNDQILMDYVDEHAQIEPVQTTGSSTTDVMSQSAVTTELAQKLAVSDFNIYSGTVDASIAGKASQGDLNALNGVVTAHTANTTVHVTSSDKEKWNSVDDKLNTSDFNTYSGNVDTTISGKVDKVSGKGLSTNDYTTAEKEKLSGIENGAQVNVQSDWDAISGDAFIKNKPTIPDSFQWFGTSSTEASTVQKEVSIPSITSLKTGQIIVVMPTVTSTVASSTLKLNSFDAYPMRYNDAAITTGTDSIVWNAKYPSLFVFDGSYWVFLGHGLDSNTTYSTMSVAEGTAGTATSARTMRADYLKQIIHAWAPQVHYSKVSVTGNLTNVTCPQTLSTDGEQCNVLYVNNSTQHTVSVSTNYKSPDNSQINLTIKANGYAEVNYLYFDGVTYVRAV